MNRSSVYNHVTDLQKHTIINLALSKEKINISAKARLMGINRKTFYSIYKSKTTINRKRKHEQAEHEIIEEIGQKRINEISKAQLRKEIEMYGAQQKLKHPEFKKSKNWAAGFVKLLWAQRESDNEDLSRSQTPSKEITPMQEESTDMFRETPELFNTSENQDDESSYNIYSFHSDSEIFPSGRQICQTTHLESQDRFILPIEDLE